MEPRSVFLNGIAKVLNAGGAALLDLYDTAASIKTGLLPGENGRLKTLIREYEKKIERLYYEIGKEIALHEYSGQVSAVAEAGIKLVAEYRAKIEKIERSIRDIEEKAATSGAGLKAGAKTRAKPGEAEAVEAEASADTAEPEATAAAAPEEGEAALVQGESPDRMLQESSEEMLKSELLKICADNGIEASERMTKAAIIELLRKRQV